MFNPERARMRTGWDLWERIKVGDWCPECREDPPRIDENCSSGDRTCRSCGLVLETLVDTRSEWRTFSGDGEKDNDPNRVGDGFNPFLIGEEMHTSIGQGRGTTAATNALARTQKSVTKERINDKLRDGFRTIDAYCASGGFNRVASDNAKQLLSQAVQAGLMPSLTDEWILAIIFHGCKRAGAHTSVKQMARLPGGVPKNFKKQYSRLQKFMIEGAQVNAGADQEAPAELVFTSGGSQAVTAKALLPRFCQDTGIPVWAETLGVHISAAVSDTLLLSARGAPNVATCIVYLLCHLIGQPRTLDELYPMSGLGKGTIQKAIKLLYNGREELIGNKFWPKDARLNNANFGKVLHPTWYSSTGGGGAKRKASEPLPQLPSQEEQRKKAKLSPQSGGRAILQPQSPDGLQPPLEKPVEHGTGLYALKPQPSFVFMGLHLPGPVIGAEKEAIIANDSPRVPSLVNREMATVGDVDPRSPPPAHTQMMTFGDMVSRPPPVNKEMTTAGQGMIRPSTTTGNAGRGMIHPPATIGSAGRRLLLPPP